MSDTPRHSPEPWTWDSDKLELRDRDGRIVYWCDKAAPDIIDQLNGERISSYSRAAIPNPEGIPALVEAAGKHHVAFFKWLHSSYRTAKEQQEMIDTALIIQAALAKAGIKP